MKVRNKKGEVYDSPIEAYYNDNGCNGFFDSKCSDSPCENCPLHNGKEDSCCDEDWVVANPELFIKLMEYEPVEDVAKKVDNDPTRFMAKKLKEYCEEIGSSCGGCPFSTGRMHTCRIGEPYTWELDDKIEWSAEERYVAEMLMRVMDFDRVKKMVNTMARKRGTSDWQRISNDAFPSLPAYGREYDLEEIIG